MLRVTSKDPPPNGPALGFEATLRSAAEKLKGNMDAGEYKHVILGLIPILTKETLTELKLVSDGVPDSARGSDLIKRLLSNLGTIGNRLAEMFSLYGTGHGIHGKTIGLSLRHAKLAVGAAAALTTFLFETHMEAKL
jgi:Abortive infection C-terminus